MFEEVVVSVPEVKLSAPATETDPPKVTPFALLIFNPPKVLAPTPCADVPSNSTVRLVNVLGIVY